MSKLDLKKELKYLYKPSANEIMFVDVPSLNFVMADGMGDPNISQDFQDIIDVLYGISYTLKFDLKKKGIGPDYIVMPLEGLWWMEGQEEFDMEAKDRWQWTLMIMQPDHITAEHVTMAMEQLKIKKNPPALSHLRFESYSEGLSVQIMHIGPYSEEGPTIEKLHRFAEENGYKLHKKHHEIYLGDPRRTKPENLRTIIRQPVTKD